MSHEPLDDLRLLGLRPGAGVDDLKPAWRRAVSDLHPDRRGDAGSPELAAVNAAFQRLQAFHRRFGRLPGHIDPIGVSLPAAAKATRSRRRRWAVATMAGLVAIFVIWPQREPPSPSTTESSDDATTGTAFGAADEVPAAPLGQRAERIDFGTPAADVERLAGPPMFRSAERWEYGPSEVRFADGLVSGWHSSPLRPLPVATDSSGSAID